MINTTIFQGVLCYNPPQTCHLKECLGEVARELSDLLVAPGEELPRNPGTAIAKHLESAFCVAM
jgi:hypothetical protein